MPKKKPVAPETINAAEAIQLATQYINQGKPRKAVTELSRLLRSDNKNAEAYNLRGMARALDADPVAGFPAVRKFRGHGSQPAPVECRSVPQDTG